MSYIAIVEGKCFKKRTQYTDSGTMFAPKKDSLGREMKASHIFDSPPAHCNGDWTMAQDWEQFTDAQHSAWQNLFAEQSREVLPLAAKAYQEGMHIFDGLSAGIPKICELNQRLEQMTGWQMVAVPGWIPNQPFFEHLAHKRFPVANFLRPIGSKDYSEEPDMFHDVFGHVPMLTDPVFGDFLVAYGNAGLRAEQLGASDFLGRLWLYTVEFGLLVESGELRAYGGGLLSSKAEAKFAVTSPEVHRVYLDIARVMQTEYHFDRFQDVYFVVDSLEALLKATEETDFAAIYDSIRGSDPIAPSDHVAQDRLY